jgi:gliding motility-associated-like protein
MRKIVLTGSLFLIAGLIYGQDSCFKFPVKAYNVINNPSFELGALPCFSGYFDQPGLVVPFWTTPTVEMPTGYLNACTNFLMPDSLVISESFRTSYIFLYPLVPQPIPDGNGIIAVTDYGYNGPIYTYPFHKSYVSTCLQQTLDKDSLYRLEFQVGFGTRGSEILSVNNAVLVPQISPSPEKFSVFGLPNCPNTQTPIIGCPEVAGWINLGSVIVSGKPGSWVKTAIQFKPRQDIQTIALGPSCDTTPISIVDTFTYNGVLIHTNDYSYFLDQLQLFKGTVLIPQVTIQSGSFCDNSIVLQMQPANYYAGSSIQWFRNGQLIQNETKDTLVLTNNNTDNNWYQCQVQNDSVCLISDSFYVPWKPTPNSSVLGNSDTLACEGDTLYLNAFTDSTATYSWQDGSTTPEFAVTNPGTYQVTISNSCGTAKAQKTIDFGKCNYNLFVPNAFTPNGDGRNDVFRVHYSITPEKFKITIFNRYGQALFSSSNPAEGWDGTIKGVKQPVDSYVWQIEFTDQKALQHSIKGTVVLIR